MPLYLIFATVAGLFHCFSGVCIVVPGLATYHHFEAHTKYLHLADKASRTVALLSERLDHHRGRGHQQIIVKHVTVNADQAVVTDQIVSGKDAALLTSATEKPMQNLEPSQKEAALAMAKGDRRSE